MGRAGIVLVCGIFGSSACGCRCANSGDGWRADPVLKTAVMGTVSVIGSLRFVGV